MWCLRIIALNAVSGVVELLYAVEAAYFIPAIYDKGLSPVYGSMLLCISPILGILFQSYLGSASDKCKCRWGKRRPFILALTITSICGFTLFPFTENIANLLNGKHSRFIALLLLTLIATTVTDFSVVNLLVPGRGYLLDVIPEGYTKFGNIVCSVWISAGAALGFGIGVNTWSSNFNIQVQIVCGISLIITVVLITLTLLSVDENNPQLRKPAKTETDEASTAVNEDHNKATPQPTASKNQADLVNTCELAEDEVSISSTSDQSEDPYNELHVTDNNIDIQAGHEYRCCNGFVTSILGNLQIIRSMSLSMIILSFAIFFGFLATFTQQFFFTDFVADVIYGGDVTAPENSTAYQEYTKGVKVGSLALGVSAISSLAISLLLGPLMKLFGMKLVLVSSYVLSMLQTGVMIFCHNLIALFVLSPALYGLITILLLIPFILISEYAAKSMVLRKNWPCADADLIGRVCSILMISMLSAEVVALMINGPLKNLYGSGESIMIVSCASSFVGAVIACFVRIPHKDSERKPLK